MFIVMCTCICTIILCRSMYHMLGWDILLQWLAKLRLQTKPLIEKLVAPMLACCCPSTSSTTKHNAAHPGLSKTCLLNPWHILTAPIDVLQKKKECQNVERKSCHVSNQGEKQLVMLAWSAYEVSDFHLTGCWDLVMSRRTQNCSSHCHK